MRFSCPSQVLSHALSTVTRALSARSTLAIYEGVCLLADEDGLKLTGSDGAITIMTKIDADIQEQGSVVLPGKLFYEVIRKMPQSEVKVEVGKTFAATVKCMGSRTTIAGQPGTAYPALPEIGMGNTFDLPQPMLKNMIQQTNFAISTDETRMILTGSLMEIQQGELRLVSLDGFRLAMRLERISEYAPALEAIIPARTLIEISKLLSDDEDSLCTLQIADRLVMITFGETKMISQLIAGEFIRYRQIMPADFKTKLKVDRQALIMCVERASLMAREGKNNLIKLTIEDGRLVITSNSESGDAYEELNADVTGDELVIAFNVRYIQDVLRAVEDDEVVMCFNTPVSPCLIVPVSGDAFTHLVLPVRLGA